MPIRARVDAHLIMRVGYYSRTRMAVSMLMLIIISIPCAFVIFFPYSQTNIRGFVNARTAARA